MKFLRLSFYPDVSNRPVTVVMLEKDLRDTIEATAIEQVRKANEVGALAIAEIFEDESPSTAIPNSLPSQDKKRAELDMAVLFHWTLGMMQKMKSGGKIVPNPLAPNYPAPLVGDDVWGVFEQITRAPDYRPDIRTEIHCKDGTKIQLHEGKVAEL